MRFHHRQGGCISGIDTARRMLLRLGLEVEQHLHDGEIAEADACLLTAQGRADALHQGWKAVQNLLEWSCGVSDYVYQMRQVLQRYSPQGKIACTRKTIPGTHLLAMQAVIAAGGIIHRAGCGETILLFTNHRRFCPSPDNWQSIIATLRQQAPEKPSSSKPIPWMKPSRRYWACPILCNSINSHPMTLSRSKPMHRDFRLTADCP